MDAQQKKHLALVKAAAAHYRACASDAKKRGLVAASASNQDPEAPCADRYARLAKAHSLYVERYGEVPNIGRGEKALHAADKYLPLGERQARRALRNTKEPQEENVDGWTNTQLAVGAAALGLLLYVGYTTMQGGEGESLVPMRSSF